MLNDTTCTSVGIKKLGSPSEQRVHNLRREVTHVCRAGTDRKAANWAIHDRGSKRKISAKSGVLGLGRP